MSGTVVSRLRAAGCVFAEDEARLLIAAARTPDELASMVERRVAGIPLEHILGWVEFCGLRIAVDPGVFVPRRRTESLAREAARLVLADAVVVDLCCGCGAVGAVLLNRAPGIELSAVDVDPAAVRCARRNLTGAGGHVYEGDLYSPLPACLRGRVDVLVANAPYVPTEAVAMMPPEARDHEPRLALDGGTDGLDVLRRIIAAAPEWLAPEGRVLVESGEEQARILVEAMRHRGLAARVAHRADLAATVIIGTR